MPTKGLCDRLSQVLEHRVNPSLLAKDRDFIAWRAEHPDELATVITRRSGRTNHVAPTERRA
jgi:hypothetical protein